VAALVSNVSGLRHSVIIAETSAPGKPRCLIAYDLGQSWEKLSQPPVARGVRHHSARAPSSTRWWCMVG